MEEKAKDARESAYPNKSYAYYVIGVLMIAYTFAYLDRLILSLLIDPIRADLGLTDTQIALVGGTSFAVCFCLFSFPAGRWVDKHGRRNIIVGGMALWSLATVACGLANSFWRLFAARMMVGVGEASLSPAAYSMIPDYFPPRRRGFATALYVCGVSVGGGAAFYGGGMLVDWAKNAQPILPLLGQIEPWKLVFLAAGFPGLLVALLVWLTVREPKRQVSASEKEAPPFREVFAYMAMHKKMFLLAFIGFTGFTIGGYAFQFWGPVYFMRTHGFSATMAGFMFGIGFATFGTLGIILGGLSSDRLVAKGYPEGFARVALCAAALQVPSFTIAYLTSNTTLAVVMFGIGMFGNCLIGGLQGAMIQAVTPNRMRGTMGAIYGTLVNLVGLGIAPTLTATMSDRIFGGNLGPALAVTSIFGMTLVLVLVSLSLKSVRARVVALQNG